MKDKFVFVPLAAVLVISTSAFIMEILSRLGLDGGAGFFVYLPFSLVAVLGFFFGGFPCLVCSVVALARILSRKMGGIPLALAAFEVVGCMVWVFFAARAFYYGQGI